MKAISRRTLLKRFLLAALAGALPATLRSGRARADSASLASRLAGCFSRPESARLIGERYLALAPEEADAHLLTVRIAGGARRRVRLMAADGNRLRALLAEQGRGDFAAGRTVEVDGWVLSRTEARLCALAAIEPCAPQV